MNTAALEFASLYQAQRGRVFGILLRRTDDPDLAEDLAQDVWVRARAAWPTYCADGRPVGAWLSRIAHNVAVDWHRRASWRRTHLPVAAAFAEPVAPDNPAGTVLLREAVGEAQALLARLTARRRAVLLLTAAGYTDREISTRLGLTLGAIKSSRLQGRRQCRAWAGRDQ